MENNNISKQIILASASPRRRELIGLISNNALIIPADVKENNNCTDALHTAVSNARKKAFFIKEKYENENSIIISADTVVVFEGQLIGKPKDKTNAFEILNKLTGQKHIVLSAVCITSKEKTVEICEKTTVEMLKMTQNEILEYLENNDVSDKAGAYGIQNDMRLFIKSIEGNYENVVGLPIAAVYDELKTSFGYRRC